MMLRILFGVLTTLLLNNCSNKNTISQFDLDVLAQVGNKIITKQDFIRRAEYTIRPDYCRQSNYIHKKIILNSLIAEKLTALEMEDKDDELLKSKNFQYFLQGRKEQAMRKLYYYDNFYNKVSVPDSLIKKRFKVAGRTVDISYISLTDLIFVQKVNDLLSKNISLEEIYDSIWGEDLPNKKINFFDKEHKAILSKLFDAPIYKDQIIGPFENEDGSFLLMRVNGWSDKKLISAIDQEKTWNDVKNLIKEDKAKSSYIKFVEQIMSGHEMEFNSDIFDQYAYKASKTYLQDLVEKKEAINKLLWEEIENPKTISFQNDANISPDDIILNYNGEPITVGKLNRLIKSHPLVFRKRKISEGKFRQELKFAIADLMRDLEINKKCYGQNLHADVRVLTNVDMWDDAYASKRYLSHVINENNLEKENKYSINNGMIDSLQNKYSNIIKINTDMFEKIEITSTDMLVTERGLPYPFIVPSFPIITSDDKLDYGSKMN